MIRKYGFWFPIVKIYQTEKWIFRILLILMFAMILFLLCSCGPTKYKTNYHKYRISLHSSLNL